MIGIIRAAAIVVGALLIFQPDDDVRARAVACWDAVRSRDEPPSCVVEWARSIAPSVLASRWDDREDGDRRRFVHALALAMYRDARRFSNAPLVPRAENGLSFRLGDEDVLLIASGDRVEDVVWRDGSAVRHYRRLSKTLIETYSFEYLVGELEGSGVVVLEDFESQRIGALPSGWKWRGWGQVDEKPYRVIEENGNRFLRAEDRGENVMLYKEIRWSSAEYPYISWRWRVRSVPPGADARYEDTADSAAGVYLSYRRKLGLVPETVKFVWSGHLPRDSAFRRAGVGMPWTVVAGSGPADHAWQRVVYRTDDVYERTFDGSPGKRPLGIAVLSDANNTGSLAAADYDDFVALRDARDVQRVGEILDVKN